MAHAQQHRTSGAGIAVVWGSVSVMRALLAAGQLDELELLVAPALLGPGQPLMADALPVGPRRSEVQEWSGGAVRLRYTA